MTSRFPLATSSWDDAEISAMQQVIASGQFTMGRLVKQFETDFAAYNGSQYCVMVNSGSSANLLMVAALFYTADSDLRLKPGDEVIVPAVSWSTTYFPLAQYGLKLRFVDIDLQTLNMDLSLLESAITNRTRAIMAVNLLGNPIDYAAVSRIISGRNIVVLEDNCESMGAEIGGKKTGTFGVMGAQSAFFSHHISTMEGGMVTTDNEELYHILLSLRSHGWTRHLPKHNHVTGLKSDDEFEESFKFVLPGYNLRPLELSGAIGIEQVRKLPTLISERRKNGRVFQDVMGRHSDILIQEEVGASSWFGFSLVVRPGSKLSRNLLLARLKELGFECRPIVAGNFAANPVMRYLDSSIASPLKNAEHISRQGLFIGNHHYSMPDALEALRKL